MTLVSYNNFKLNDFVQCKERVNRSLALYLTLSVALVDAKERGDSSWANAYERFFFENLNKN